MSEEEQPSPKVPKDIQDYAHNAASRPIVQFGSQADSEAYQKAMRESGPYLTLGIQMAVSIAAFTGIGYWIDSATGSNIWLGIMAGAGAVLSLVFFLVSVIKLSQRDEKKFSKKTETKGL